MTSRAVQLGLIDGADRGVGPLPMSVVHGVNADLIKEIAPLYLTGSVLDVTYGQGMWWRRFTPQPFAFHDLALDGVDFRALPYGDRSWDTVCFDPPYVPRQGPSNATHGRDQDFRERFGLVESRGRSELWDLIGAGLTECARVMDRWLLVKCNDFTNGRQFHVGSARVIGLAEDRGLRCHDLIVHASGTGPGGGQIKTVQRTRRAHSYLLVFERVGRTKKEVGACDVDPT